MHHRLRVSVTLVLIFWAAQLGACPILSEADQILTDRADRAEWTALVKEAAREADIIVVARVSGINVEKPTKTLTRSHVAIEPISMIKGAYSPSTDIFWDDESNDIVIGCGYSHFFDQVQLTESFRYLLYLKEGRILHAARVTDWPHGPLSTEEELNVVQSQ